MNFLKKREVEIDESAYENISEACQTEFSKYEKCFTKPTEKNYSSVCTTINSAECKNFVADPKSALPSCLDQDVMMEMLDPKVLEGSYLAYEFFCANDESGNPCPFSSLFINNNSETIKNLPQDESYYVLKSTCESAICREATYNMYKVLLGTTVDAYENLSTTSGSFDAKTINGDEQLIAFLNSDECRSMAKTNTATTNTGATNNNANAASGAANNNTNAASGAANNNANATSGATNLKVTTGLFVSLGLLLLSFY
jgi:hypothetical protein